MTGHAKFSCLLPTLALVLGAPYALSAEPTVDDVELAFSRITHHGDPIGWHLNVADVPDFCRHYQGAHRFDGPDGTPYLFMTRSGNHPRTEEGALVPCGPLYGGCGQVDCPGELVVVRFGSRPKHRERMRSNKLRPGLTLGESPPDRDDLGVVSIRFNGTNGWPAYHHAGGGQIVDGVLVVPLESPFPFGTDGALIFIDVSDPMNPRPLRTLGVRFDQIGVVGVTQDPVTKLYLYVLTGGDASLLRFCETTTADPTSLDFDVKPCKVEGVAPVSWDSWQTMNFIRQTNGDLYLACAGNHGGAFGSPSGEDWIRLYKVSRSGDIFFLTLRESRHRYLNEPNLGNTDAASGFHVTPNRQLLFYVGAHHNTGPDGAVDMGEFRRYDLVPSCGGWAEFYEDETGWSDNSTPDRSVIFDYVDRAADDWNDLSDFGFNDDIESIRWNIPRGHTVRVYEHANYSGLHTDLTGAGSLASLSGLPNAISSVVFEKSASPEVVVCPTPSASCNATSVRDGLLQVVTCSSGVLSLQAGPYNERLTIKQPVTLKSEGGPATIGAP